MKTQHAQFKKGGRVRLTKVMRKKQQGGPFYRQCAGRGTVTGFAPSRRCPEEYVVVRFPRGDEFGFLPKELERA